RMLVETLLTNSCSLHMIEAPATGSLGLRFTPAALLDALWLQFACAIDGNKDYRQCQECKRWFELSPGIARADRLFCSNACRTRAYRQRIAHARQRYKTGASIADIAREFETDCDTVQGWVTTSRKPRCIEQQLLNGSEFNERHERKARGLRG